MLERSPAWQGAGGLGGFRDEGELNVVASLGSFAVVPSGRVRGARWTREPVDAIECCILAGMVTLALQDYSPRVGRGRR